MNKPMLTTAMIVPLAALTFLVWVVYMAGLASLQNHCQNGNSPEVLNYVDNSNQFYRLGGSGTAYLSGVEGFSAANLSCSKVYRFWWFIMAYEFVLVVGIAIAAATGILFHSKLGFMGLFAVAFMLYIQASNDFLMVESVDYYQHGQPKNRIRTTVAGAIMVAVMNGLIILALGAEDGLGTHYGGNNLNNKNMGPGVGVTTGPVNTV